MNGKFPVTLVTSFGILSILALATNSRADLFNERELAATAANAGVAEKRIEQDKQIVAKAIYSQVYWSLGAPNGGLTSYSGDVEDVGDTFTMYGIKFSTKNGWACRIDSYSYAGNLKNVPPALGGPSSATGLIQCYDSQNHFSLMNLQGRLKN